MFPRMNITNPFQSFAFGVPQYGVGFGGINPMVSNLALPYASNPIAALSGIGVNPYMPAQTQNIHPLLLAQLAQTNPTLPPSLAQHSAIWQNPYGVQSPLQPQLGQGGSPFQQFGPFGAGIGQWGNSFNQGISPHLQQAWGQQWGAPPFLNNPIQGLDPFTGALIAQQSSPFTQNQAPIRPLITLQQPDPFQIAALTGAMTGQATDPYSILAQTGWISPVGVNPIHQALKQPYGSPHAGIPF